LSENLNADEITAFFQDLLPHVEKANIYADAQQREIIKLITYFKTAPVSSYREKYAKARYGDIPAPFIGILIELWDSGSGERFMQRYIEQRDAPQRIHDSEYRKADDVINRIDFNDLIPFLHDVEKHGLREANMKWKEKPIVYKSVRR
jgi:hypothetical protein